MNTEKTAQEWLAEYQNTQQWIADAKRMHEEGQQELARPPIRNPNNEAGVNYWSMLPHRMATLRMIIAANEDDAKLQARFIRETADKKRVQLFYATRDKIRSERVAEALRQLGADAAEAVEGLPSVKECDRWMALGNFPDYESPSAILATLTEFEIWAENAQKISAHENHLTGV